uniref:Uncharacterized protein n=1 Tax=Helianthus annuus TaxID=4232 RepID=A0A251TAI9_HELAN
MTSGLPENGRSRCLCPLTEPKKERRLMMVLSGCELGVLDVGDRDIQWCACSDLSFQMGMRYITTLM